MSNSTPFSRLSAGAALCLGVVAFTAGRAQTPNGRSTAALIEVNSEVESYLRILQLTGAAPFHIWSVREFGPAEAKSLIPATGSGPWASRVSRPSESAIDFQLLSPEARLIENTSFPYGFNEGPVWAGRGLTAAVSAGFIFRAGPLSITAEPTAFRSQNQSFTLAPTGQPGKLAFADPATPTTIDRPQRFGDGAYQRLDAGQSAIRLELPYVSVGASTANQHWGPAVVHPLLLGNNAPGYYHVYFGTSGPIDLWLFKLNARTEAGRLDQSDYSPAADTARVRLMTGVVASLTPRFLPNLELGGARFFHSQWTGIQLSDLYTQKHGLLGTGSTTSNQLASLFARSVFSGSGIELYVEYARDDANFDQRDLILEPDHVSGYTIGGQKVFKGDSGTMTVLRGEVINTRVTDLQFTRPQAQFYVHSTFVQGHTERGEVLGSVAGYGGGGWNLAVDRYASNGKWSFAWDRIARSQPTIPAPPLAMDILHSLSVKRELFRATADLSWGVTLTREFNRNFTHDATNVRLEVGTRLHW